MRSCRRWQNWPAYKKKLKSLRNFPESLKTVLETIPATAHPMDVLRTGVSALGTVLPEAETHPLEGAQELADRLLACLGPMLLYWYHYSHYQRRIELETADDSVAGHFLHLLHGKPPPRVLGEGDAHLADSICRA